MTMKSRRGPSTDSESWTLKVHADVRVSKFKGEGMDGDEVGR
jgi:hypothetical protein